MVGDKDKYMGIFFLNSSKIYKSYFKRLVEKEKENLKNSNLEEKFNLKLWVDDVTSNPSRINLTIIILFNLLLFLIYLIPIPLLQGCDEIFDIKLNSSILTALMTVVLGLLIFSAESLRDKYSETHSVLMTESKILFITITLVFHLLFSFFETLNMLTLMGTVLIALITLLSLYKVIITLLNKTKLPKLRGQLLSKQVIESLDDEIDKRIGNNILFRFIEENNLHFKYSYFSSGETEKHFVIKATNTGIINDIDFSALKDFSDEFYNICNKNQSKNFENESNQPSYHEGNKEEKIVIYFNKLFNEKITEYNNELFTVNKEIGEEEYVRIRSIALKVFKIEKEDNANDIIKTDLMYLKDEFITSIRNGHVGKIEVLKNTYIIIAEEFLKKLKSIGGVYNSEQARNERTSINGKFEQLDWLSYDLRDILREAFDTKNELLIRLPMFIPTAITNRAIHYNDHLLFQEFVEFSKYIYKLTETADFKIKKFVIDRISMHIRDSYFYFKTAKKNKVSDLNDLFHYSKYYFKVLQDLLKDCYDNNDEYGFSKFYIRANKLSDTIIINYKEEESSKTVENINKSRLEMYYGLRSWMFWDILEEKNKNSFVFFNKIKVFDKIDLKEFIEVYINMNSNQNKSYWGRSWWEFEDLEEETSIWIKEDHYDDIYFVYQCLLLISINNYSKDNLRNPHIFTHEEIIFKIRYEKGLLKIISDYRDNFIELDSRINEETIQLLLNALENAKKKYEEFEKEKIRLAEISTNRINSFKLNFIKEFHEKAYLRELVKNYTKTYHINLDTTKEGVRPRGINKIEDKKMFIEDTNLFINEFGTNYGRGFAKSEDLDIMMKITSANKYTVINLKAFYNLINDSENLFIITNLKVYYDFFSENNNVINNWLITKKNEIESLNAFEGKFVYENKEIPIFLVRNLEQDVIYIFDKTKFGKLVQYSPRVEETVDDDLLDIFSIKVDSYSHDNKILNKILQNPPNWLIEKGDKSKQSEFLKEYVRIMIYENYEFIFDENFVGYILNFEE